MFPLMLNILIVDDSDIWRRLAKDILKKNPYRMFEADSGERALEVAREMPLDLVIMDYRMYHLDGLDTSRQLREIPGYEQVPVILITSENFPGDCEETPAPYVDGYVDKKHLIQDLDDCVKRHLDRDARVA
jgi:CheY-like chemotaxis protein